MTIFTSCFNVWAQSADWLTDLLCSNFYLKFPVTLAITLGFCCVLNENVICKCSLRANCSRTTTQSVAKRVRDSASPTIKPLARVSFCIQATERGFSTEEEWSLQHSSVFPGLSVCESWYFGSQHGSTRGVRLTTVIVPCRSRLPQPWDWTMKYSKMPGLREGGLWQCNVKCETIEHL